VRVTGLEAASDVLTVLSGIGLSNPQFLAKTWGDLDIAHASPIWKTTDDPDANLYTSFLTTSAHALVILNVGSFVGGLLFVLAVPKLNRVSLQKCENETEARQEALIK
jgi:MFS transporter, PHS family, inorganic phosphate transporter